MTMTYTIYSGGDIIVGNTLTPDASMSEIPNVGTLFTVPGGLEKIRWYGKGTLRELRRKESGQLLRRLFQPRRFDDCLLYGERRDRAAHHVKWMTLTNSAGTGLMIVVGPRLWKSTRSTTRRNSSRKSSFPWDLARQGHHPARRPAADGPRRNQQLGREASRQVPDLPEKHLFA